MQSKNPYNKIAQEKEKFEINRLMLKAMKQYEEATDENDTVNDDMTDDLFMELREELKRGEIISIQINAKPRMSKAEVRGSKVLMANGNWKNIEDIKIGDKVISPLNTGRGNTIQKVIDKKEYKNLNICELRKSRTNEILYKCCEEHQIPVKTFWIKTYNDGKKTEYIWKNKVYQAGELADKNKCWIHQHKPKCITSPILTEIESEDYNINPYLLGLYLGDGCINRHDVNIYTGNRNVKEWIENNFTTNKTLFRNNCWRITPKGTRIIENKVKSGSYKKELPEEVLRSSYDYRKRVFEGLLDSDGTIQSNGYVRYTTASKKLAEGIKWLVKTLGCRVNTEITYNNCQSFKKKRKYYRLNINVGLLSQRLNILRENRLRNLRKLNLIDIKNNDTSFERITINRIPQKMDGYCIEVDGESKLYVTDKYTVTHNSTTACKIGKWVLNEMKIMGQVQKNREFGMRNIARDDEEYSRKMRNPNLMHDVIITDESNALESTGENATIELAQKKVFSDVHAGRYIHRINCSPQNVIDDNTDIRLEVITRDKGITNARLYYKLIRGGLYHWILLGHVNIDVSDIIKNWELKVKKRFFNWLKTGNKKDKEFIDSEAKKDWYIEYCVKKYEKMDLITKEGILRPRELSYAGLVLDVEKHLEPIARLGLVDGKIIRSYVENALRKRKIPYSIIGVKLISDRVEGILILYKSYFKIYDTIIKTKDKYLKGKIKKEQYDIGIITLEESAKELKLAMETTKNELERYMKINEKYNSKIGGENEN